MIRRTCDSDSRQAMPQTSKRRTPRRRQPGVLPAERSALVGLWLDRLGFGLLAAVVISRLMMLETLRNALAVSPGAPPVPAGPGPTAGLVLDLLACVPALLLLARRWVGGAATP